MWLPLVAMGLLHCIMLLSKYNLINYINIWANYIRSAGNGDLFVCYNASNYTCVH